MRRDPGVAKHSIRNVDTYGSETSNHNIRQSIDLVCLGIPRAIYNHDFFNIYSFCSLKSGYRCLLLMNEVTLSVITRKATSSNFDAPNFNAVNQRGT